jgi:hypothetical protein
MTEPLHDLGHAFHPQPVGQSRSRQHDDWKAEHTRSLDLGVRAVAAGIAGDDPFDAARPHHLQFAVQRERSARHDDVGIKGQCVFGRIDEPQSIGVLRPRSKRRDVLPADCEQHARAGLRQRRDCGRDIRHLDPVVAGNPGPWRALERDQPRFGRRASRNRVAAYFGCERMRGVDDICDFFATNVIGKAGRSTEAPNAGRQRLACWRSGASTVRIDRVKRCARHRLGKQIGVRRSTQNERARHG